MTPLHPHHHPHTHDSLYLEALHGFLHPLHGVDHILALALTGIWACMVLSRNEKYSVNLIAILFSAGMIAGIVLSHFMALPVLIESTFLSISLILIGLFLVIAFSPSLPAAAIIISFFALLHGNSHAGQASISIAFSAGLLISTLALHLGGTYLAKFLTERSQYFLPVTGYSAFLFGTALLFLQFI